MNKERLGNFISNERKALGLTQKDLASALHVTDKAVSKWERGMSYPDVTLLEPLAAALDLTVEELMACRRQEIAEEKGAEETMQNLLDISRDSVRKERRRSWKRIAAVLMLLAVTAAVVAYTQIMVTEEKQTSIVLKETEDGINYIYVEEGRHLLKLQYEAEPDFETLALDKGYNPLVYDMTMRYNRLTREGTVTACADTGMIAIGSEMNQIGSGMGMDVNPDTGDALFGYTDVAYEFRMIYPNPDGEGFLYTYVFWRSDEENWQAERLLAVEDCLTFTAADLDDDGVTELIVRTRWPEKPYTVYDYEDGTITEIWPDTVDEELMGGLMTDAERQAELERQLRQGA